MSCPKGGRDFGSNGKEAGYLNLGLDHPPKTLTVSTCMIVIFLHMTLLLVYIPITDYIKM